MNKRQLTFLIPLVVFLAYVSVSYVADWFRYYMGFRDIYFYGKLFSIFLLISSLILSLFYFLDLLLTQKSSSYFKKAFFFIVTLFPILYLIYILLFV
jgi:hypothetical protein